MEFVIYGGIFLFVSSFFLSSIDLTELDGFAISFLSILWKTFIAYGLEPSPSDDSLQAAVGTFLPPEHADRRPVRFIFNEQAQAFHMEGETLLKRKM
jgi:hypothetical protein